MILSGVDAIARTLFGTLSCTSADTLFSDADGMPGAPVGAPGSATGSDMMTGVCLGSFREEKQVDAAAKRWETCEDQ